MRERLVWTTRIEKGFLLNGESTRLWKDESLQKLERRRNTIHDIPGEGEDFKVFKNWRYFCQYRKTLGTQLLRLTNFDAHSETCITNIQRAWYYRQYPGRMERRIVESTLFAFLLFDSSSSSSSSWNGTKALSSLSWFYPCVPKRPNNRDTHFFPSPLTIVSRIRLFPAAFFVSIFDPFIRANNSREEENSSFQSCKISLSFFLSQPRVENLKFKWGAGKKSKVK